MKLIYTPKTKAGEYAPYAMSFYEGCTEKKCTYCYMNTMSKRFNSYFGVSRLKPWLLNVDNAYEIFKKEVDKLLTELRRHGLFFNFSSDPCLPDSLEVNLRAFVYLYFQDIPITTLTKQAGWVDRFIKSERFAGVKEIAFGFTLTGHDELEPGASTNQERIDAMRKLHEAGFKTFASIEPIIDFKSSLEMILKSDEYCDLLKIGLKSGGKYDKKELIQFIETVNYFISPCPIYWKDSLLKQSGIDRSELPENCVNSDYNMFEL